MMNASRGSYNMNGAGAGAAAATAAAVNTSTAPSSHFTVGTVNSDNNLPSSLSAVEMTRSPSVTSSFNGTAATSNGKYSNGGRHLSMMTDGNEIIRYRMQGNGRVLLPLYRGVPAVPADNGIKGTRAPSCADCEKQSQSSLASTDVRPTSVVGRQPTNGTTSLQNGNGIHLSGKPQYATNSTSSGSWSNGIRCPQGSQLETTYVDCVEPIVDHPFFALTASESNQQEQIVSSRGTVRGVRNRVKAGIAAFIDQMAKMKQKDYRALESGKVVVYTTSVMVVRDTYDKCLRVNKILQTHVVRYEQRDVSLSRDDHRELMERLGQDVDLPQVFADGVYIGDADEIVRLNENGTLRRIFQRFKTVPTLTSCAKCGGYRYVPCGNCHGSKKSRRNNFTREFCALRCTTCDDNGLVLCDLCSADDTSSAL